MGCNCGKPKKVILETPTPTPMPTITVTPTPPPDLIITPDQLHSQQLNEWFSNLNHLNGNNNNSDQETE